MLLELLMAKAKKDDDKIYNSAFEFFMCQSQCQKGSNSYWKWKCCSLKCSSYYSKIIMLYKILPQIVYVLPSQVMNPIVNLSDNLELPIYEYQWLLDSL